jgi:tetratricopeptide (TPR) repeat protein
MSNRITTAGVIATTALALSLSVTTFARADRAADDAKRLHDKAKKAIADGNYETAQNKLIRAIGLVEKPEYIADLCMVYDVLYDEKNYTDWSDDFPIETCEQAVNVTSGKRKKQAVGNLASLKAKATTGKAKRAADKARHAAKNGRDETAIELYEKAIELVPEAKYLFGLCKAYHRTGDTANARKTCKRAKKYANSKKLKKKVEAELSKINATDAAEPSADTKVHLEAVYEAVRVLDYVHLDKVYDDHVLVQHIASAKTCVDGVDALLASGMKKSDEMRVHHSDVPNTKWRKDVDPKGWVSTLGDVQTFCVGFHDGLRLGPTSIKLNEALDSLVVIDQLKGISNDPTAMVVFSLTLGKCNEAVDKALSTGISKKTNIELNTGDSVTLGTAKKDVCARLSAAIDSAQAEIDARVEAARQAELAPYKKALKGDKLRLLDEYNLFRIYIYGKGGETLSTPKELAKAKLWFIVSTSNHDTKWTMRRYQFSGHKLEKESTKHGPGAWPKPKHFK